MKHHKIIKMGCFGDYLVGVKKDKWVLMNCVDIKVLTHKIIHNIFKKFKEQNIPLIDTSSKKWRRSR